MGLCVSRSGHHKHALLSRQLVNGRVSVKVYATFPSMKDAMDAVQGCMHANPYDDIYTAPTGEWIQLNEGETRPLMRRSTKHIVPLLDRSKLDDCGICLGPVGNIAVLQCLHIFCRECVETQVRCPVCLVPC